MCAVDRFPHQNHIINRFQSSAFFCKFKNCFQLFVTASPWETIISLLFHIQHDMGFRVPIFAKLSYDCFIQLKKQLLFSSFVKVVLLIWIPILFSPPCFRWHNWFHKNVLTNSICWRVSVTQLIFSILFFVHLCSCSFIFYWYFYKVCYHFFLSV